MDQEIFHVSSMSFHEFFHKTGNRDVWKISQDAFFYFSAQLQVSASNPELHSLVLRVEKESPYLLSTDNGRPMKPFFIERVPSPCFPLINHYFYKKTKPLYPNPKYLFGIGVWIWAAKNLGFSVSLIRVTFHRRFDNVRALPFIND